ncbi:MAG: LacI family DNA-binding transcriptional regulator [Victivallaceae bacterium]|nr:LacI family DNA-binding transcriptional regulator [Victivallaceae bacterium]
MLKTKDKIDISYLAKALGLANSTVSKALNDRPGASAATKEKVEKLVRKLNYTPNHFAKALKMNKSNLIAFVMPEMGCEFFTDIAKSIVQESKRQNYHAIFTSSENSPEEEIAIIKDIFNRHIDGLIVMPCVGCLSAELKEVLEYRPCVIIDNYIREINVPFVGTDFEEGIYLATRSLIENGHRKTGLILGPQNLYSTAERFDGYKKALKAENCKMNNAYVKYGPYTSTSGKDNAKLLLRQFPEITALLCSNIELAKGAAQGIAELGLKIPEDISLVGFGGGSFTAVDQKNEEIGQIAAQTLFRIIDGEKINTKIIVKPEIVNRNTVRNLKQIS